VTRSRRRNRRGKQERRDELLVVDGLPLDLAFSITENLDLPPLRVALET
jgi:hypothetical protein